MPRIPDFASVGIDDPRAAGVRPQYPSTDPVAEAQEKFGAGLQKAGTAASAIGADMEDKRQKLNEATATTDFVNRLIPLHTEISTETDPGKILEKKQQYNALLQTSAQAIDDPLRQKQWVASHARTLLQAQADADERLALIKRQNYGVSLERQLDGLIDNATKSPDAKALDIARLTGKSLIDAASGAGLSPQWVYEREKQFNAKLETAGSHARITAGAMRALGMAPALPATTGGNLSGAATGALAEADQKTQAMLSAGQRPPGYPADAEAPDRVDNREVQDNNFGGLRKPGVVAGPNAGGFQAFATPEEGIAAISQQLDRYASGATTGKPLRTLREIVSTWAPPNENPTDALIARAAKIVGVDPDQPLDVSDPATKAKLIEATIRNEQGGKLPVDKSVIAHVAAGGTAEAGATGGGPNRTGLPSLRQMTDTIFADPTYKNDEERFAALRIAQTRYTAMEADAARAERVAEQQRKAQDEQLEGEIIADAASPTPKWTAQGVMTDPRLSPEGRMRMLNFLSSVSRKTGDRDTNTYGPGFYDAFRAIHAPDGDPNKITSPDQLYSRVGPDGDLTVAGLEKLRNELISKRTPEGEAAAEMKKQFLDGAHKMISGADPLMHLRDPKGEELYLKFLAQTLPAYEEGLKKGKSPAMMFNPDSPDYLGKIIPQFRRSPQQMAADFIGGGEAQPAGKPGDMSTYATPDALRNAVKSGAITYDAGVAEAVKRGYIPAPPQVPLR